ncbi:MAG: hypothetical protein DRP78_07165 [Candidatus Omnitrophota bacterium]|nr:MAG: hypothetical protein DRP78_07165 [Candidatus Omnitrophota bacterium]
MKIKTKTAIECAKIMLEFEGEQFQNNSGYRPETVEELAEMLETQEMQATAGNMNWFQWEKIN